MRLSTTLAAMSSLAMSARAAEVHGEGSEGTIMGPVAFLWPDDRPWSASTDNSGPCGSSSGVSNRTTFPMSQGSVALSIADDAYKVAFYISFDSDPTSQSQFTEQIVSNVTEVDPGHQCYKIDTLPSSVTAGSNATIQLEYWADYDGENGGKNETFYACADITFVEATDFTLQVPCFNVTASDFSTGTTGTSTVAASTVAATSASSSDSSSSGLSKGAIAGIAVGTIAGSLAVVGAVAFMMLRKRRSDKTSALPVVAPQMSKTNPETASVASTY